jgi:uncharacterized C2H2 Zn-finger protein
LELILLVKCPNCEKEVIKPEKSFINMVFSVEAYKCGDCKTKFKKAYYALE